MKLTWWEAIKQFFGWRKAAAPTPAPFTRFVRPLTDREERAVQRRARRAERRLFEVSQGGWMHYDNPRTGSCGCTRRLGVRRAT